jgi:hypothetical protein
MIEMTHTVVCRFISPVTHIAPWWFQSTNPIILYIFTDKFFLTQKAVFSGLRTPPGAGLNQEKRRNYIVELPHCKENTIYVFRFWELLDLIPNFLIPIGLILSTVEERNYSELKKRLFNFYCCQLRTINLLVNIIKMLTV